MAVTNVLAAGITAASSSAIVVSTASGPKTVSLMTVAGGVIPSGFACTITKLNSSATQSDTGMVLSGAVNSVTGDRQTSIQISAFGSYLVNRPALSAGSTPVGVDVDDGT